MNELLNLARSKSHIMDITIEQYGNQSLKEYVKQFKPYLGRPLQSADDFLIFSKEYNKALLGEEVACELNKVLRFPLLNTANHHGVDYFPPSVQGNLLFWQTLKENGIKTKYLPICSFGIVSLSNSSYARGITSYANCRRLFRIPIFPKSIENKMVRYVPAFTEEQIKRTIFRLEKEFYNVAASKDIKRALEQYYLDPHVLEQEYYGDQAVLINQMLSRDMYPEGDIPQIVYMEMEQIINRLLLKDLKNENSVIYRILYDKRILNEIRRQSKEDSCFMSTMFFWGKDSAGRRYGLDFCEDGFMRGTPLSGEAVELSASADDLSELIEQERIVPSGYTMAVLLSFARGYTWLGGYFQGDYLSEWQRGTAAAFAKTGEYGRWAEHILQYDCTGYISGPVFAMSRTDDGLVAPAGPLEIIRNGGINLAAFNRMLNATVKDSHMMGLYSSYPDLVPNAERVNGWSCRIGQNLLCSYTDYCISKYFTQGEEEGIDEKNYRNYFIGNSYRQRTNRLQNGF